MGFISTVPEDAGERLKAAVVAAMHSGGNFPCESMLFIAVLLGIGTDVKVFLIFSKL